MSRRMALSALPLLALFTACKPDAPCTRCDTLIVAAVNEPSSLIPPLAVETVGRDIDDQLFERLANLEAGHSPTDSAGYAPGLATGWERVDSVTWRFHLRTGAAWSDGHPVTAQDVVFSFSAFADSVLDALARSTIEGHIHATVQDSSTVLIHFDRPYAEQLYDATWHVRVFPAHIWEKIPTSEWAADTSTARLIGSGPFKVARWTRGELIELVPSAPAAASAAASAAAPALAHLIWRFVPDPDAALNLVLAHEADLLETLTTPERAAKVAADSTLQVVAYPSAAYGFVGYHLTGNGPLSDRRVRRALNMAVDRAAIATQLFGPGAKAPPGPISQVLWLWDDGIKTLPYDTAAAARELDQAGWKTGADQVRHSGLKKLAFDILVPATSSVRKRAAEALQERWRGLGAAVTVTAVDFPVFQQRLAKGAFDSYVATYLDEPSPRGLADQWTKGGIGALNFAGYANPAFERLFRSASAQTSAAAARPIWREAMDTLNADAPALFLFAPVNQAAAPRRLGAIAINPWSWLSEVRTWGVTGKAR